MLRTSHVCNHSERPAFVAGCNHRPCILCRYVRAFENPCLDLQSITNSTWQVFSISAISLCYVYTYIHSSRSRKTVYYTHRYISSLLSSGVEGPVRSRYLRQHETTGHVKKLTKDLVRTRLATDPSFPAHIIYTSGQQREDQKPYLVIFPPLYFFLSFFQEESYVLSEYSLNS